MLRRDGNGPVSPCPADWEKLLALPATAWKIITKHALGKGAAGQPCLRSVENIDKGTLFRLWEPISTTQPVRAIVAGLNRWLPRRSLTHPGELRGNYEYVHHYKFVFLVKTSTRRFILRAESRCSTPIRLYDDK